MENVTLSQLETVHRKAEAMGLSLYSWRMNADDHRKLSHEHLDQTDPNASMEMRNTRLSNLNGVRIYVQNDMPQPRLTCLSSHQTYCFYADNSETTLKADGTTVSGIVKE